MAAVIGAAAPGRPVRGPGQSAPDGLTARRPGARAARGGARERRDRPPPWTSASATVKTHVNRIFAKTGSRDRAQAVRYAYQHGLATPVQ